MVDSASPFSENHAFLIGINEYKTITHLHTAVNDARRLAEVLQGHGFTTHLLIDPTKIEMEAFLEGMYSLVKGENSRVIFYFAGHGLAQDHNDGIAGYLVPADGVVGNEDTMIAMTDLQRRISDKRLRCRHFLLILDCCFAGSFRWAEHTRFVGFIPKKIYRERYTRYIKTRAWQVLTSAATDEKALDMIFGQRNQLADQRNSVFAQALIEALGNKEHSQADYVADGIITLTELYLYVRDYLYRQLGERFTQSPQLFPLLRHDKGEFLFLDPHHPGKPESLPSMAGLAGKINPYKGLSSYELGDQHLYFGREEATQKLLEHTTNIARQLVVVTGASGSGKSSLVKAGLVPILLKQGYVLLPLLSETDQKANWEPIRPGIGGLALLQALPLTNDVRHSILIIDQFEEVQTQIQEKADRVLFLQELYRRLKNGYRVLITIRSDFEPLVREEFFQANQLGPDEYPDWNEGRFIVPLFSLEDLRKTIVRPAIQVLADFETDELVDDIIKEVIGQPNALPLLSYTLSQFYDKSETVNDSDFYKVLKVDTYKKLGGVYQALHMTADNYYKSLSAEQQAYMQQVMLRMVTVEVGSLAKKRVMHDELKFDDPKKTEEVERICQDLTDTYRLLVSNVDENKNRYYEPTHDALLAWPTLRKWIEDTTSSRLLLLESLNRDVRTYQFDKETDKLWTKTTQYQNVKLIRREQPTWLNRGESDFLQRSERSYRRNRIQLIGSIILAFILITGAAVLALLQRNEARKEAVQNFAARLASDARVMKETDPTQAIRLLEVAWDTLEKEKVDKPNQLLQELSAIYNQDMVIDRKLFKSKISFKYEKLFRNIAVSPDGKLIAIANRIHWNLCPINIYSLESGDQIGEIKNSSTIESMVFDLQTNKLIFRDSEGVVYHSSFQGTNRSILKNIPKIFVDNEYIVLPQFRKYGEYRSKEGQDDSVFAYYKINPNKLFFSKMGLKSENLLKLKTPFKFLIKDDKIVSIYCDSVIVAELPHTDNVEDALFIPNTSIVLTFSTDKIFLWDLNTVSSNIFLNSDWLYIPNNISYSFCKTYDNFNQDSSWYFEKGKEGIFKLNYSIGNVCETYLFRKWELYKSRTKFPLPERTSIDFISFSKNFQMFSLRKFESKSDGLMFSDIMLQIPAIRKTITIKDSFKDGPTTDNCPVLFFNDNRKFLMFNKKNIVSYCKITHDGEINLIQKWRFDTEISNIQIANDDTYALISFISNTPKFINFNNFTLFDNKVLYGSSPVLAKGNKILYIKNDSLSLRSIENKLIWSIKFSNFPSYRDNRNFLDYWEGENSIILKTINQKNEKIYDTFYIIDVTNGEITLSLSHERKPQAIPLLYSTNSNLLASFYNNLQVTFRYPEAIIEWLKTADAPPLSNEMRERYNLTSWLPWYKRLFSNN